MVPHRRPVAAGRNFVVAALIALATLATPGLGLLLRLDWDERTLYLLSLFLTLIAAGLLLIPRVSTSASPRSRRHSVSRLPWRSSLAAMALAATACTLIVILVVIRLLDGDL